MTEQSLGGETQSQETGASQLSTSNVTASEKMLPQSKVDELVKTNKLAAYEQGKKEALAEAQKLRESNSYQASQNHNVSSMGGMAQISEQKIQELIDKVADAKVDAKFQQRDTEAENRYQQEQLNNTINDFAKKVGEGAKKYPDFEAKVKELDLVKVIEGQPTFLALANSVDNPADVLYDLAENPQKLANILSFAGNPGTQHLAARQIKSLSDSIKANQSASNYKQPNEPLSQLKTSPLGTDNGRMSVAEFKNMPWLKA